MTQTGVGKPPAYILEMECWPAVIQWENSAALPLHCWGG